MKRNKLFSVLAAGLCIGFVACNSSSDSKATNGDSLNNSNTNGATSSGNYAARADTINTNVAAGYYLNPRTGKKYTKLNVDRNTGVITDESGAPVRRYVDTRTWWVYDAGSGDTLGSARMENGNLMYRGNNGEWQTYDKRWTDDTTMNNTGMNDSTATGSGADTRGHTKMKVKSSGDKMKKVEKSKD